ncbi:CIC11C00000001377 [Sungouiella intermedia]|uniref:Conserved oligomeric Golgi complex subunit 6 n=1 Tax=Sungouiella intermedia TaxID=45354 RepID=A0A1L0BFI2_9ASCO|nr:CIC11C00000001377 [[Candida] intermedia]
MDFVGFESFSENDLLPSPQPSLSLPLKSNIENLGLKLSNFNNLRNLLKHTEENSTTEDAGVRLAEKFANVSLQLLDDSTSLPSAVENLSEEDVDIARSTTLTKRLGRALNPSLSDQKTRELFTRLESKIPDMDVMVDAGVIGAMTRKNLRGEIESDLIKSHLAVLADYAKTIKNLKYLGERVDSFDKQVAETNELLAKDLLLTADLSGNVKELTDSKVALNLKKGILMSFREQFTLNEYDNYVLHSNEINADFFAALAKAEAINSRCLVLLALDNPELGRKVMAKNNELINRTSEKILSFCSRTLSNFYLLNNRARMEQLHLSLRYLKGKPDQLESVVNLFVNSRSTALVDEFNLQTSGHGADDSTHSLSDPRPVFYSSHDPVRLISDSLAFVHSLVVNESETVENLFGNTPEFSETTNAMVSRILNALAKPIKSQIELLISVQTKLPLIFQIFSNLDLYLLMFQKISNAGSITSAINECIRMTQNKVVTVVTNRLATVRNSNLAQIDLSSDLQPPEWIIDYYSDLLPILDNATTEMVFNFSQEQQDKFLLLVVDEPISIFYEHLSLVSKTFGKRDILIFKLNFLDLVLSKTMPLRILSDKVLDINHQINDYSTELKEVQLQTLLENCQLTDFYNIISMICPIDVEMLDPAIYQAITENKLFKKEVIVESNAKIQLALPSALIDIQSALMKLNSPIIVTDIITSSSIQFAYFYKLLSEIVEMYLKEQLFSWTDLEVATLLGVELAYIEEIGQTSYGT